jgi:hypothetical protein
MDIRKMFMGGWRCKKPLLENRCVWVIIPKPERAENF